MLVSADTCNDKVDFESMLATREVVSTTIMSENMTLPQLFHI